MKGLFYREFFLGRKSIISGAAIFLIMAALCILVRLSLMFGNLSRLEGDDLAAVDMITYYFALYLPGTAALLSINPSNSAAISDLSGKWGSFAKTLPAGAGKQAAVKLSVTALSAAAAYALGSVNAVIIWSAEGKAPTADFFMNMFIAAAAVILYESLSVPLMLWFKTPYVGDIPGFALVLSLTAVVRVFRDRLTEKAAALIDIIGNTLPSDEIIGSVISFVSEELAAVRNAAFAASFPIVIISLAAGFLGTKAALERKV